MTAPATPVAEAPQGNAINAAIEAMRDQLAQGVQLAQPQEVLVPEVGPDIPLVPGDVDQQIEGEQPETPEGVEPEAPELTPEQVEAEQQRLAELTIEIPEWRPGETPLEITVETKEQADQLKALINSRELKAESMERLSEANDRMARVNETVAHWRVDPVGQVQRTMTPDQQVYLAMSILTEPAMFDGLKDTLAAVLQDPNALTVVRSNLRVTGMELAEKAKGEVRLEKAQERNVRDLRMAIEEMIPSGYTAAQRKQWKADAFRELGEYTNRTNTRIIDPRDLTGILAGRLRASNVDPQSAADAIHRKLFTRSATDSAGSPSRPPTAPPAPQPNRLVASAKALAAASASAPSGAGAPTASMPPIPKGVGVKEAVKLFAKQAGVRVNP